ncbi:MAG: hypothetical protein H6Q72_2832 [Firmicutes bacterium]|nr:hypothetical protein [Bacillota bacterium]
MAAMEQERTATELWQDYAFLTREISKFVEKHDVKLVLELLDQREKLQVLIENSPDDGYKATDEGQELLQSIRNLNQLIASNLQRLRNNTKRSQEITRAYDQMVTGFAGSFMDRKS